MPEADMQGDTAVMLSYARRADEASLHTLINSRHSHVAQGLFHWSGGAGNGTGNPLTRMETTTQCQRSTETGPQITKTV